jgi:hypothetical protein
VGCECNTRKSQWKWFENSTTEALAQRFVAYVPIDTFTRLLHDTSQALIENGVSNSMIRFCFICLLLGWESVVHPIQCRVFKCIPTQTYFWLQNYQDRCPLGYNRMYFGHSPTFRRNILPENIQDRTVSQSIIQQKQVAEFGLHFDADDGSDIFLRNVGLCPNYTVSHPRI